MDDPEFSRDFVPAHGEPVPVAPGITRITVNNPSPFTFHGTNTYIVGDRSVCVVDPGPEDEAHFEALMRALEGREVTHIAVTHTHRDHSPLARRLKDATGAATVAQGPHRAARPLHDGETNPFGESADMDFVPDIALDHGARIEGDGWALTALFTPGHAANHVAFAVGDDGIVLSGDHVMAWSTSIVAPPDGSMADYMASLERLIEREDNLLLPGHGGPVKNPQEHLRDLKEHRLARERAILDRLRQGDRSIDELVKAIYRDTDPAMHAAAGLSVMAHIEHLVDRKLVATDGAPSIGGIFRPI